LQLFDYQKTGADFLAARRYALLGDKMGLGKTIQAIEAFNITGARRVAVACPAIAKINWQREVEKWSLYGVDLKVESYNKLATDRDLRNRWAAWRPDVLVIDEAHYLKTADSSRTKALYGPHCRNNGLAGCAGAVWGLSGTLTPNNAAELFPHLRALFPDALPGGGTYADFLNTYTRWEVGAHGPKVLGNKNLTALRAAIAPHLLRRVTEEVLPDLPPVFVSDMPVDGGKALQAVKQLEDCVEVQELIYRLEEGAPIPDADPHIASFRKVCGIAKAEAVAENVIEMLENDQVDKIVLFAYHREVISILREKLAKFSPVHVWGGDSDALRQRAIDSFQTEGKVRVFIGQITACATAVTLTAAHHCVFVETSWVPSDNEQAIYRMRRIGQKSQIMVRIAHLDKSIDEAIQRTVARKVRGLLQLYGESNEQ
jgi:SNF2 family DNA or RNA helicase